MKIRTKKGEYTQQFKKYMNSRYYDYTMSNYTKLTDIYKKPSQQKKIAFRYYSKRYVDVRILSHNTNTFVIGYIYADYFCVKTHENLYTIPLKFVA